VIVYCSVILFLYIELGSTITNGFTIQTTRGVMGSTIYQLSVDSSAQSFTVMVLILKRSTYQEYYRVFIEKYSIFMVLQLSKRF
jgi:hypothetical protein